MFDDTYDIYHHLLKCFSSLMSPPLPLIAIIHNFCPAHAPLSLTFSALSSSLLATRLNVVSHTWKTDQSNMQERQQRQSDTSHDDHTTDGKNMGKLYVTRRQGPTQQHNRCTRDKIGMSSHMASERRTVTSLKETSDNANK